MTLTSMVNADSSFAKGTQSKNLRQSAILRLQPLESLLEDEMHRRLFGRALAEIEC